MADLVMADHAPVRDPAPAASADGQVCDVCGSPRLVWRKCKLVCDNCRSINKSCADL